MATPPLIASLLLDAQEEFLRAVEHVPPPGRGGIGRLNTPAWVVAHAITTHDSWLTVFAQGGSFDDCDASCADWYQRQMAAGTGNPVHVDYTEALEAAARVFDPTPKYLEGSDAETLSQPAHTAGTPWHDMSVTTGYMVARGVAHLFAHAGELSVIASLVRAGDLGLPGRLSHASSAADDAGEPFLTARLVLDAREEFLRVAEALPAPARVGAFDRLNSGASIVAHVASAEDRFWNERVTGGRRDAWLAELPWDSDPPPSPPYDEALEAFQRVTERSRAIILGLTAQDLGRAVSDRGATVASYLARSASHLFAHAGELQAIGSLTGMSDLGLPGRLRYCAGLPDDG